MARWTEEERHFVAAMIGEGFDAAGTEADYRLAEAMRFALSRGEHWGGGYVVAEFPSGTFIGRAGEGRWFPGMKRLKASALSYPHESSLLFASVGVSWRAWRADFGRAQGGESARLRLPIRL